MRVLTISRARVPTLCASVCARVPVQTILITGATKGIGAALAEEYAAEGKTLILTGRNEDDLARVSEVCTEKGARVITQRIDVTEREAFEKWVLDVDARRPIDLVIANAGVSENTSGTDRDIVAATRTLFQVNIDGVFNTILPLVPRMKERGSGQIALMSSLSGFGGMPGLCSYAATKNALRTYGLGLRGLLYRDGVHVNVIMPGFVKTPLTDSAKIKKFMMMSAPRAARIMKTGLANDTDVIAFPWQLATILWWVQSLPSSVRDWVARSRMIGEIAYFGKRRTPKAGGKK